MANEMKSSSSASSSWVAYDENTHFPIQNLPYGVFRPSPNDSPRVGVAIGDQILDLSVIARAGLFNQSTHLNKGECFSQPTLNGFMQLGRAAWTDARQIITNLLDSNTPILRDNGDLRSVALVAQAKAVMELPAHIGDYTDFYSSKSHAYNCGVMFRGAANAMMPNWLQLPVGYHGRASSVVVSGTPVVRPRGIIQPDESKPPVFDASRLMDFELEMAQFIGPGTNWANRFRWRKQRIRFLA